jgi:uncharacterized protein
VAHVAQGIAIRPLASFATQPWRNGGGTTRPLAEASDGAWRISLASVERDGPYSRFAGMTRLSLVIHGAGVTLRDNRSECPLRSGQVAEYDGDIAWDASLLDGPVLALNAMAARGVYRASIRLLTEPTAVPPACFALALTLEGTCTLGIDGVDATLDTAHVLLRDECGPAIQLTPHGDVRAALVIIERI